MNKQIYKQLTVETQEPASVLLTGSIAWDNLHPYYTKTLQEAAADIEIDGFRPGKAPLDQVESHIGQMKILSQAAQAVLGDAYPAMVIDNDLRVIGYPQISITKIAYGSDLEFSITTATMPTVTLADYGAIAARHNADITSESVSDEEFDAGIEQMKKMYESMQQPCDHEHAAGESCPERPQFELTDAFVAQLGDYTSAEDFKTQFRDDLMRQKEQEQRAKHREAIILEIVKESQIEIPEILIQSEKEKMMAAMKDDIARMGLEYSEWLKHNKKTEEELQKEMHPDAVSRAKADIILKEIAVQEKITSDPQEMEKQMTEIKKMHPDVPEENIRMYLENVLINESVLTFLEKK